MTDILERLRAGVLPDVYTAFEAADEIEKLRKACLMYDRMIHEKDLRETSLLTECLEQARLLGMSGEREASLRGEIERLKETLRGALGEKE